ncbi:hypothetical protein [Halovivax sp.]|uniref:hypothetical protein n=1 Tax=Halovivax sp. TaxID=1935978 RepID=UPI0025C4EC78|nr:hypothetical protein [Halovivax sp.]
MTRNENESEVAGCGGRRGLRPTTRRSWVAHAGVAGLAAAGGLALTPSPPDRPATVDAAEDAIDAPYQGERVADEDDAPIARYQYRAGGDEYVATAPINVVFPLAERAAGLPAVMAVLAEAGWTRDVEEYARYAWDRERERYVHQEATAAETYLGLHGRNHVRCWEFEDVVSMQAHEDTPARPRHGIASYADGRAAVEDLFREAGWRVAPDQVDLANERGPDHDGTASIVVPGEER